MVKTFSVYVTPYRMERTIYLYLPDDWQTSGRRYPVVYMYDGHNLFSDETATYGTCWGMKDYLDAHPDFIVVGQDCNHTGDARLTEYCPYTVKAWGENIDGTGKAYMEWVVNELKPYIDANYPTLPDRAHTAVGGSSMGGLMSVYSAIAHNDVFSKAACLSSSIMICMPQLFEEMKKAKIDPDTRMYWSWGENELKGNKELVPLTNEMLLLAREIAHTGADIYPHIQPKGKHCEASWAKLVPMFMEYLFG